MDINNLFTGRIIKAYGEHWNNFSEQVKNCALKHSGYIAGILLNPIPELNPEYNSEIGAWRPKTLSNPINLDKLLSHIYHGSEPHTKQLLESYGFTPNNRYKCEEIRIDLLELGREIFYDFNPKMTYNKYTTSDLKLVIALQKYLVGSGCIAQYNTLYSANGKIYNLNKYIYK